MKMSAGEDGKNLTHQLLCKRKVSAIKPSQRETTTDPQGSQIDNLRNGPATAVSLGRKRWEGDVPKAMALRLATLEVISGPAFYHAKASSGSILFSVSGSIFSISPFTTEKIKNSTACYLHIYMKMSYKETAFYAVI